MAGLAEGDGDNQNDSCNYDSNATGLQHPPFEVSGNSDQAQSTDNYDPRYFVGTPHAQKSSQSEYGVSQDNNEAATGDGHSSSMSSPLAGKQRRLDGAHVADDEAVAGFTNGDGYGNLVDTAPDIRTDGSENHMQLTHLDIAGQYQLRQYESGANDQYQLPYPNTGDELAAHYTPMYGPPYPYNTTSSQSQPVLPHFRQAIDSAGRFSGYPDPGLYHQSMHGPTNSPNGQYVGQGGSLQNHAAFGCHSPQEVAPLYHYASHDHDYGTRQQEEGMAMAQARMEIEKDGYVNHFGNENDVLRFRNRHRTRKAADGLHIPTSFMDKYVAVKRLFQAIKNTENTVDEEHASNGKIPEALGYFQNDRWTDEQIQVRCWELMAVIVDRTLNGPIRPEWQNGTPKKHVLELPSFSDRLHATCEALQRSKNLCKRVFDPDFMTKLVDDPAGQLHGTASNKKINANKGVHIRAGRRALGVVTKKEAKDARESTFGAGTSTTSETDGQLVLADASGLSSSPMAPPASNLRRGGGTATTIDFLNRGYRTNTNGQSQGGTLQYGSVNGNTHGEVSDGYYSASGRQLRPRANGRVMHRPQVTQAHFSDTGSLNNNSMAQRLDLNSFGSGLDRTFSMPQQNTTFEYAPQTMRGFPTSNLRLNGNMSVASSFPQRRANLRGFDPEDFPFAPQTSATQRQSFQGLTALPQPQQYAAAGNQYDPFGMNGARYHTDSAPSGSYGPAQGFHSQHSVEYDGGYESGVPSAKRKRGGGDA